MTSLGRIWAGHLYGTNTGKLFLELESAIPDGEQRGGMLRVSDDLFGLSVYAIEAELKGSSLVISGRPETKIEGLAQGDIIANATVMDDGHLSGEWKSSIGTAGAFKLFPHFGAIAEQDDRQPEQIYTSSQDLGALRLFKSDISELISTLKRKFPGSRIVVTHFDRGAQLMLYSDDFEKKIESIDRLDWIKLNVQSPLSSGFSRSLTIDLGPSFNRVTTQGPDESWVLGEALATISSLKLKQSWLSTQIGRHRVNINLLIALSSFVVMPDLALKERSIFICGAAIIVFLANFTTQKLVPNFVLDLKSTSPSAAIRFWPSALSWVISATAGLAAKLFYDFLQ